MGIFGVGWSSPTPFATPSEADEDQIAAWLATARVAVAGCEKLLLVCHTPPYDTAVDMPEISAGLRINPQTGLGRIRATSVAGSYSKFGVPLQERPRIKAAFARYPWLHGFLAGHLAEDAFGQFHGGIAHRHGAGADAGGGADLFRHGKGLVAQPVDDDA